MLNAELSPRLRDGGECSGPHACVNGSPAGPREAIAGATGAEQARGGRTPPAPIRIRRGVDRLPLVATPVPAPGPRNTGFAHAGAVLQQSLSQTSALLQDSLCVTTHDDRNPVSDIEAAIASRTLEVQMWQGGIADWPAVANADAGAVRRGMAAAESPQSPLRPAAAVDVEGLPLLHAALDQMSVALLLLDGGAVARYTNASARRLLDRGDGLCREGDRVSATGAVDRDRLHTVLARIAAGSGHAAVLSVQRCGCAEPLLACVVPAPGSARRRDAGGWCAWLWVVTPGSIARPSAVQAAFGLTGREASVASAVMRHGSLPAAAGELCIAVSTARSHLQHAFDKTGTRNQVGLAQMLMAMSALPDRESS